MASPIPSSGVPARVREAKAAGYRDLLLDVAEAEFGREGYEATPMKAVAANAAVSLATLYQHFPTKMDLYRAVHARRLTRLGQLLAAGAKQVSEPLEQMLSAMRIYVTFHMEHPAWLFMHLREGNAWSGNERLRSPEQTDAWNRGIAAMARTFRAGIASGVFVEDDAVLLARTTNALHQVALSRWADQGMKEPAGPVVRRLQARFVRAFCVPEKVPSLLRLHGLSGRS